MLRRKFDNPLNACCACGHDFAGLTYFDQHRVGRYEPLESGAARIPEAGTAPGRRCLDEEELEAKGLSLDGNGRWTAVAKAEQARAAFRRPLAA